MDEGEARGRGGEGKDQGVMHAGWLAIELDG